MATTEEAISLLKNYDMFASSRRDYHFYINDTSVNGKERYNYIKDVFDEQKGNHTNKTAWDALKAASQEPSSTDITSNTQWTIVFDNTNFTAEIVVRRNWDDVYKYEVNKK